MAGDKGGGDQTTTQKVEYPKYIQDAQKTLAQGASKGMGPYLNDPSVYVAPLANTQQKVGSTANGLLDYNAGLSGMGNTADYTNSFIGMTGQLDPHVAGAGLDALTVDMQDIMGLSNPYASAMLDSQARQRERSYRTAQSDIGAEAAAGGAFGGSGEAIRRSMLDRNMLEQTDAQTAQTMYDSYGMGAQLAGQNAAATAQNANDIYSRASGAAGLNLQALGSGANYANTRILNQNSLANDYTSRMLQSAGLLGGYGDLQRSLDQQMGDRNWTQFGRLAGYIPGVQGSQQTTQTTNNTGLLGTALTAASLFM